MITKKQFCEHIIAEWCDSHGMQNPPEETYITQSSSLGVAMEHLGLIKDQAMLKYIQDRAGIYLLTKNGGHLSTRELLEMLPE